MSVAAALAGVIAVIVIVLAAVEVVAEVGDPAKVEVPAMVTALTVPKSKPNWPVNVSSPQQFGLRALPPQHQFRDQVPLTLRHGKILQPISVYEPSTHTFAQFPDPQF